MRCIWHTQTRNGEFSFFSGSADTERLRRSMSDQQDCWCPGDIRWGNEETWHVVSLPKSEDSHKITCILVQIEQSHRSFSDED